MNPRGKRALEVSRCPSEQCDAVYEVSPESLGRNINCPVCGMAMTARPLGVDAKLDAQQRRISGETGLPIPRLPLVLLVDNVRSLWNVGSFFRTADACGVRELILAGITGYPPRVQIAKTALGAERAVAWRYRADSWSALEELQASGYTPVAVEATPVARPFDQLTWPACVCLVVGSEVAGISPRVLEACPHHVSIPMRGVKDSLNVAVAFGIVVQHAARILERTARMPAGPTS
jgi:tRNA G18 (ribose-2'-O)-methylase SpoU